MASTNVIVVSASALMSSVMDVLIVVTSRINSVVVCFSLILSRQGAPVSPWPYDASPSCVRRLGSIEWVLVVWHWAPRSTARVLGSTLSSSLPSGIRGCVRWFFVYFWYPICRVCYHFANIIHFSIIPRRCCQIPVISEKCSPLRILKRS